MVRDARSAEEKVREDAERLLDDGNKINGGSLNLGVSRCRALLKVYGMKYMSEERAFLDVETMRLRLLAHAGGTSCSEWYIPTAFGRNWRGFWSPFIVWSAHTFIVLCGLFLAAYAIYLLAEEAHDRHHCRNIFNWQTPPCQMASYFRRTAENCIFEWYKLCVTTIAIRLADWGKGLGRGVLLE